MTTEATTQKLELLLRRSMKSLLKTEAVLEAERAARREPIAIVSMACRLPGGIVDPESYWELLEEGQDAVEQFPPRWEGLDVYDPNPDAIGKSYAREGGFMRDVELFDAGFFGTGVREARAMDPQHRLLLETAWEALERAGIQPSSLNESSTGVYVGAMGSDYGSAQGGGLEALDGYVGTGTATSVLSGRVAYVLGLQGPALTVDTACSSSLTALHLACAGLRQRECDLALVGGVTVMSTPSTFVEFSRLRAIAPDGRCKSFSARADGAGCSEGCGVLVLKRLSDAQRDGDRVLALVRGSAVNQDGRSQGLSAPNGPAQQRVIRDALESAGLSPSEVDALEAHGTGTTLGDPIEAGALAAVFGPERAPERPLYLGSSKSNLGHTQAAAGVTGVIKMVLSLQHELLPKTLHAEERSPHVAWEGSGLSLLQEAREWKRGERIRRAGVSSFGLSGTNAHVVLEEAPTSAAAETASADAPVAYALPLLVSGRDEAALRSQAQRLHDWLRAHPEARWADVVHTAALHRAHFDERAVVMAPDAPSSLQALEALAKGKHDARVVRSRVGAPGKVVFVFPGQGSQWQGMGKALLSQSEVFAQSMRACDAALARWTGWSVLALLRGEESEELPPSADVDAVQASLFAMYVSLAALWRSWGLEPAAVVGHSQGEVAAAVVSGALSLEDGARVVAARGHAVRMRCGDGGMMLVECPVAEVEELLPRYGSALSIAAVNTASSTVVSGENAALESLKAKLESASVFCRMVNVDYASHSAQMDLLLPGLLEELSTVSPRAGKIPLYSTVEGRRLDGSELDASYWCRNLREPVRFDRALAQLLGDGHGVFVEVSPHPVLGVALHSASDERGGVVIGSLVRESGELSSLLRGLGELHAHGCAVDWKRVLSGYGGGRVELPTYAFQRERFWLETAKTKSDLRSVGLTAVEHPLLGAMTPLADSDGYLFSSLLSVREQAWLRDHGVAGTVLLPGVSMLELALHAGRELGFGVVRELVLAQPLVLPADGGVQLQLSVGGEEETGERSVALYSRTGEGAWVQNATGELQMSSGRPASGAFEELRRWPVAHSEPVDLSGVYARAARLGFEYGPAFQGLVELRRAGQVAYGRIVLPDSIRASAEHYDLHPALFDAAMHPLLAFMPDGDAGEILLPFAWSDVQLYATGASELRVRAELVRDEVTGQLTAAVTISDGAGEPVARVGAVQVRPARLDELRRLQSQPSEHLYRVEWSPALLEVAATASEQVVVLGGAGELARQLGATWCAELEDLLARAREGLRPTRVIVDATRRSGAASLQAVHASTAEALAQLQALLSEPGLSESELVWVTRSALGCGADREVSDLVHAPVWGLLRAARSEHAERSLRLVDLDGMEQERELLARGLSASREPELALRGGVWLSARLQRAGAAPQDSAEQVRSLDPEGTVLITGGTGELGSALAEHLVAQHGVKRLVLTSRRGADAPGAAELVAKLSRLGAQSALVLACDVTVRSDVAGVLASIPSEHPLTGVFHLSAVLDDGLLQGQTAERLSAVLAPKVDGAWHLHELTEGQDLARFVLFSSAAGTLGNAGQSNYAAANAFLDALAAHRQKRGLAGISLAWGLWQPSGTGLTAGLSQADLVRLARAGVAPLSAAQALALLDSALSRPESQLVPMRLELGTLQRTFAQAGAVPALWSALVHPRLRRASARSADVSAVRARLAALPASERLGAVRELLQGEIAALLGLAGPSAVPLDQPLLKLGLNSLTAIELNKRLRRLLRAELPIAELFSANVLRLSTQLAAGVEGAAELRSPVLPSLPADPHAPFPLTPIQQAYWVGRQWGPKVAYHFYRETESCDLDLPRLEASWRKVIARHDALRIVFTSDGTQRVLREVPEYVLPVEDLRGLAEDARNRRLEEVRAELSGACRPVDVWPLFELRVLLLPDDKVRLCVDLDGLCLDAASVSVVMADWTQLYQDPEARLPELMPRAFEAVVRAGVEARATERYQRDLAYWNERRPSFDSAPQLPQARGASALEQHRNTRHHLTLHPDAWQQLCAHARAQGITPTMTMCTAFAEVLSRWSAGAPFLLNLTNFTRPELHPNIYRIAGDFTNLVFLECQHEPGSSFATASAALQAQLHAHLEHSSADGVEILRAWRQAGTEVSVPVVFTSLLGLPVPPMTSGKRDWQGEQVFALTQTPQVWMDCIVSEFEGGLYSFVDVVDGLFPTGMVEDMIAAFQARLEALARDPAAWTDAWPELRPERECARIAAVNDTAASLSPQTLHGLFAEHALSHPERVALIQGSRSFSYGALHRLATRLGRELRERGARPNELVAIVMRKGWEQVAGVLSVLYSGAAYVPIDAGLPPERLKKLLSHSGARLALVQEGVALPDREVECLVVDDVSFEGDESELPFVQTPSDLAYVIYTSGSTGEPKGVMIEHRGPVNYLLAINAELGVCAEDRAYGLSSLSFDLSVYDMFGMFAAGGGLVLPTVEERSDPALWASPLAQGVTVWNSVPSLLQLLVEHVPGRDALREAAQGVRKVMLSGDWIPVQLPDAFRAVVPEARVISVGGATETSINSVLYPIERVESDWTSIPWGWPMPNQTAWVLDAGLAPCPSHVPGEIYVGGVGIARGYWGDPEQTAARFIEHPRTGERLYRSGDWGRWQPDGNLEFLGRRDQQVQVQGYRVELGEIETALERHPLVERAVVVAIGDREKRLIAHVAPRQLGAEYSGAPQLPEVELATDPTLRQALWDEARKSGSEAIAGHFLSLPEPREREASPRERAAEVLSLAGMGRMLERLRQVSNDQTPIAKALYASGGSLYPVQVLVSVRPSRVHGLEGGTYYYRPDTHELCHLSSQTILDRPGADFAFLMLGRLSAIAPLYGEQSEPFCAIEAGAIARLLEQSAVEQGWSLYPVPGVELGALGPAFGLEPTDICLHALCGGAQLDSGPADADILAAARRGAPPSSLSSLPPVSDPLERLRFKMERRGIRVNAGPSIVLPRHRSDDEVEHEWVSRRSFRSYERRASALEDLSGLLGTLRDVERAALSARSLNAVEVYVSVQPEAVEGLSAGAYRYDALAHRLLQVSREPAIGSRRAALVNQAIVEQCGFVIVLVGRFDRIGPLYGSQSERQCWLEVGQISQRLEGAAARHAIGLCHTAGTNFAGLETALQLGPGEICLHALAGGKVDWSGTKRGWSFLTEAAPAAVKATLDSAALRKYCDALLPGYMVPVQFQLHQTLPLNTNGKVDRAALARASKVITAPDTRGLAAERSAREVDAQAAALMDLVSRTAAESFEVAQVPPHTPFVELGANSLMALRFRERLQKALARELPVTIMYDYPTVAAIVDWLQPSAASEAAHVAQRVDLREPIALVGMSCRTPGHVIDPEGYWELLREGRDAIGAFPERWDVEALYDPNPDARGKTYARAGGFLDGIEQFDTRFFEISPREAVSMDPQQRLVLEVAWEALERAGIQPRALKDSVTGVYVGTMGSDYQQQAATSLEDLDGYGTGGASSVLAGRLSYVLGLQGPSLTVDTACSSSLVALHLACTGLRQGECDLALVGGVQLMIMPTYFVEFSRLRGLAEDGRCKSFSASADGVAWAEGCGMLVLKRLSDAQRDGDRVLAVVRGSAVNHDGRSQGLTAPHGPSQQRVIRKALEESGLQPRDIDAIEAHGTGTPLGDPIEAGALAQVFGPERDPGLPLYLGTVKSNIGHGSAAAGVLGVIKVALSLEHELLPKTLHASEPSPHVPWESSGLSLLQDAREWKRGERIRRAGVSAFGVGGTNAHVVIEEAPAEASAREQVEREACDGLPLLLSGRDEAALRAQAQRLADWLRAHPEVRWVDVVHTAALHRTHFDERAVVLAPEALEALARGQDDPRVLRARASRRGKVVFVFPAECSLELGVRLSEQWRSLGIEPAAVVGAGQGEVVAAVVSGALSPEDGARLMAAWSRSEQTDALPPGLNLDQALPQLLEDGHGVFVEVSAHPVLGAALRSACEERGGVVIGTLSREQGELSSLLRGLGELHAHGCAVDWKRVLSGYGGRRVELPTYAFQRERFWLEAGKARSDAHSMGLESVEHPLLGAFMPLVDSDGYVFPSRLSLREHRWLRDHAVQGTVLVPGAGMLELALHAGSALGLGVVRELVSARPLVLPSDGGVQLHLSVGSEDAQGKRSIALYSRAGEGTWVQNAMGELQKAAEQETSAEFEELRRWSVEHGEPVDLTAFYARLATLGLQYGPAFQGLVELRRAGQVVYGRVVLPDSLRASAEHYGLHPALFESALHAVLAFVLEDDAQQTWLPLGWSDVRLYATGASELRIRAERREGEATGQLTASVTMSDGAGEPVARVGTLQLRRARLDELLEQQSELHCVEFRPLRLRRVSARADASVVRARLVGLPAAQRLAAVRELLQAEIAAVLGLTGPSAVPLDQELLMLGMASLSAVELSKRLSLLVGATVPTAELFTADVLGLSVRLVEALESGAAAVAAPKLQPTLPADPHAPFPLMPIQEAYWVGRQLGAKVGFHAYRETESCSVDLQRLEASWREVIARHEALRIVFTSDGMQRLLPEVPEYVLPVEDLRALDEGARGERLQEVRAQLSGVTRPVDVWPLFEFRALLLPEGKVRLCMDFDLLCLDGTSLGVVLNDWWSLYEEPGRSLPELMPRGFESVVRVGLEARASERYQRDLEYWNQRRPSFDAAPQLPKARGADALPVHRNVRHRGRLSAEAWRQLGAQARACSITPTMTLCTAFAEVLSRWSSGAPFLLNLTRFGRPDLHPNIYKIAGDFTNLLFLECSCEPGTAFATNAAALQAQLHSHMEHGSVDGVEVLRAWRQAGTEVSAPVVFTSMLGLPVPPPSADAQLWQGEEVYSLSQTPQVWLDFIVSEVDGELQWSWDVIDGLFPAGMIEDMLAAYTARLEGLARDASAWRDAWPELRPEPECARIAAVNATSAALTAHTLHGLFVEQALSHPERVALIHDDRSFSYGALHRLAIRLGRQLRERGARPNELVAVVMRKGWEQVAGVLSVLYSGAAYVPIDAGLPPERLTKLLRHSGAHLALVQQDGALPAAEVECLVVSDASFEGDEPAELAFVQTPSDLAYVIYTSGSTGEPKGVMIDHLGPVNYLHAINAELGVCADDRAYGLSALSFDLSVYDMFGMFAAGGALVLPTAEERSDPALWSSPMSHGVTVWNTVPSLLQLLVEQARGREALQEAARSVRKVMLSGDWIPVQLPDAYRALVPDGRMISLGGATETSVASIMYRIDAVDPEWASIPWGRPMPNQTAWVLDAGLEPCPTHVPGEFYIGGVGVARGYWADPEQTAARFIEHPRTGERLYRTGDFGRWQPDGNLEFLGRRDQQVKVQGYRIELAEIELVLERHPAVERAAVVAIGDREKHLVAHLALRDVGPQPSAAGLEELEDYERARHASPEVELVTDPALRLALWEEARREPEEATAERWLELPKSEPQASPRTAAPQEMSLREMGRLLECLRQVPNDHTPFAKALYASPGSLYPVQLLVSVRPSRVDGLEGGTYYYRPDTHELSALSRQTIVDRQEADFAFVLVGRLSAIAPLYGALSESLCTIEAGAIARLLEQAAVEQGIALYPMPGVELGELATALGLEPTDICLHALCGGAQLACRPIDADILAAARRSASPSQLSSLPLLQDPLERLRFKMDRRGIRVDAGPSSVLPRHRSDAEVEQAWVGRRSFRSFERQALALEDLSGLLSELCEVESTDLSARSLAPVQAYVSVRPGAVEGLPAGVYRHDARGHRLLQVCSEPVIDARRAALPNQAIVEHAGFAIVLVGRFDRIGPLYGAQSERQCWVEVGRITQRLEGAASRHAIGLCQIASTNFDGLEAALQLGPGDRCLHAIAGGRVDWSGRARGWSFLTEAAQPVAPARAPDPASLRKYCEGLLAPYMIPSRFQLHQTLPLNANGKVDRGALARASKPVTSLEPRKVDALEVGDESAALMKLVSRTAAECLEVAHVPPDVPFVELGANSMMALRFRDRLQQALGRSFPATLLYDYPTVRAIVDWLQPPAAKKSAVPAQRLDPREPIAIIGMSVRAPGHVIDLEGYWDLLREGRDVIGAFPERWDVDALYDPNPDARGKTYTRSGGFLDGIELFDTRFFEISPREAVSMDPQQRLVLEVAWEALERAGIQPRTLKDSVAGVYVGTMGSDYQQQSAASLEDVDGHGTGGASSVLAGRLSYVLGVHGPSLSVDTACSSSLVTLHLACAGLRQGECDLALAGGVQLMITPNYFVEFSRLRGLAEDGRCKSFSASADGLGWAEGCGMLVLKRLSDAQRDGDRVLAVVRGSAVNHDGRSQGLTAPNGPSQQRVIRKALEESGLEPRDIDAIEAHGTGTPLGDPIEAGALAEVFGPEREPALPLHLGTVKSNLGHTSAAAGVLGVIKVALSLEHELLPKTLHAEEPSPHVQWEGSGLSLLQEARAWKRGERIRRAGVSAFGVGGTNAHVVIEEAPAEASARAGIEGKPHDGLPLLISGRDEAALRAQAQRLGDWLRAHPEARWVDVVHTAALHRTHFEERAVVMAPEALEALAQGQYDPRLLRGRVEGSGAPGEESGQGELSSLRDLGELHAHGHAVDWKHVLSSYGGRAIELPTYAFQRERFWLEAGKGRSDARSMGLVSVEHPLLGALTPLADSDGYAFSSRLSVSEQSWLADHAVQGAVLLPGTGLLELALHAGRTLGLSSVSELMLEQPLLLSRERRSQLQVSVGAADAQGERSVSVYSREDEHGIWQRHASGTLQAASSDGEAVAPELESLRSWPPAGAEPVSLEGFYARIRALGLEYGPSFQGLTEAYRDGGVVYGRAVLPEALKPTGEQYGLHPALLDAALQLMHVLTSGETESVQLPFAWSDVRLHATGASELRVRMERTGELGISLLAADGSGEPVASIGALQVRPARPGDLRATRQDLYRVEFQPVPLPVAETADLQAAAVLGGTGALAGRLGLRSYADVDALRDEPAPERVIIDATERLEGALVPQVHAQTAVALAQLQALLSEERLAQSELVWVTSSAVASGSASEVEDLVHAPLWGLIRAARSEHPERTLRLVDLDSVNAERELSLRGLWATRESELALRGDAWLAARFVRASGESGESARPLAESGTVLITGGTGELGSALAEHLVSRHGVKHLVLTSRRGDRAPGTRELVEKLAALGAESVEVPACDVTVRAELEAVLSCIPSERPLTGVFHLAAVLADGLLGSQTAEQLSAVLAPKVDGAWHLHELTQGRDLACFVAFSSATATIGNAGQSNYAAANAFLDALAAQRRQRGLAALSLGWGPWQPSAAGLTAHLKPADLARMARAGVSLLSAAEGLALLDAALSREEPQLVPIRLDLGTLQRQFEQVGTLPSLWRALLRPTLRRASAAQSAEASALRARLAGLPESERVTEILELVQAEIATVLGLRSPSAVGADQKLLELGLDSLLALEIRNRLSALSGTKLPATLAFDRPTPAAIATLISQTLSVGSASVARDAVQITSHDLPAFAELLLAATPTQLARHGLVSGLLKLRNELGAQVPSTEPDSVNVLSDDARLISFLEDKFGAEQ